MTEPTPPGTAVTVQERPVVHSPVAIWDSGDFEQMQRVAVVLVRSGLVPDTLAKGKWLDENGKEVEGYLDERVVAARCTLVCNQARLWNADPLNVLQCTSLINGRLMYEGKLIAAVVASMTGVKLAYKFGLWETDHIVFPDDESKLWGAGDRLAIRCYDPNDETRFVDGSVGLWKTTRSGSPWSAAASWPRQLRYRANREWARAYEPGVILGILADGDQEVEELSVEPKAVGLMERLKGHQEGDGFDQSHVEAHTAPKRTRRTKAQMEAARALERGETVEVKDSYEEADEDEGLPDLIDQETGEVLAEGDRPTETASVPDAEAGPVSSASVTDASTGSQEEASTSGGDGEVWFPSVAGGEVKLLNSDQTLREVVEGVFDKVKAEMMLDEVSDGFPEVGEVYHLEGDEWDADSGRRPTYKDGQDYSSAKRETGLTIYPRSIHDALEAEEPAQETPEEAQEASPALPEDFQAYIDAVEAADSWKAFRGAMTDFYKTETFKALGEDGQNRIRARTWQLVSEMGTNGGERVDPGSDLSAFRLWLETSSDAEAINGTFDFLRRSDSFKGAPTQAQSTLQLAVKHRLDKIARA